MHRMRQAHATLEPAPPREDLGRVIVGVCEEGLSFLHRRYAEDAFRTKTRFQCFWNQNDAAHAAKALGYGSELLKAQMDAILSDAFSSDDTSHAAGDARLYRLDGATVAELAGRYRSRALKRADDEHEPPPPMIGVQLRRRHRLMRDAFGPVPDADMLDAVRYVVKRSQDIGGAGCHALVSLSAGKAAWQQDGSSLIEAALDELMDTGACSVVLPSGSDDLSGNPYALRITDQAELPWTVRADCTGPSFAEIWFARDAEPSVELQIVPPDGIGSPWFTRGEIGTYARGADVLCSVVHLGRGARGDGHMILVALAPTAARGRMRRAPSSRWLIRLRNKGHTSLSARAWMQCEDASDDAPLVTPAPLRGDGR